MTGKQRVAPVAMYWLMALGGCLQVRTEHAPATCEDVPGRVRWAEKFAQICAFRLLHHLKMIGHDHGWKCAVLDLGGCRDTAYGMSLATVQVAVSASNT